MIDAHNVVRLTDFGLSERYDIDQRGRALRSLLLRAEVATGDYDPWKVDVWALGLCGPRMPGAGLVRGVLAAAFHN